VLFLPQIASDRDGISRVLFGQSEATFESFEEFVPSLDGDTFGKTYERPVEVDVSEVEDPHALPAESLRRRLGNELKGRVGLSERRHWDA
jgi:hypothetical protein